MPYEAAMAIAHGLPPEEGLKSVTLYPAQILGVADKFSTVVAGKRGNIIIAAAIFSKPRRRCSRFLSMASHSNRRVSKPALYDKYRKRLDEVRPESNPHR